MNGMRMAVLAIGMVVHTAQQDRAAGAAGSRRAKGIRETDAFLGETIEIRRTRGSVAIGARMKAKVIRNHQQDIALPAGDLGRRRSRRQGGSPSRLCQETSTGLQDEILSLGLL